MGISAIVRDARVYVQVTHDTLTVLLRDDRKISAPLDRFPRLQRARPEDHEVWEPSAAGYGIHWPLLDEDLSVDGLLRGEVAPET
jgi:hypothetical protein